MNKKILLQKSLIGHYIESIPEGCNKSLSYVLQGDGIVEIRKNKLGTFYTNISQCDIPGLEKKFDDGWELNVPLVPSAILEQVVSFFRKVNKIYNSEVFLQIFYDLIKDEYFIHCPKQTVSGASVKYENNELLSDKDKILVLEIHSHNTMNAFFSSVDDNDEKGDRFYGVVGKVNDFFPEIKLRVSLGGRCTEIDIGDIFDLSQEPYHCNNYSSDWINNVKERKVEKIKTSRHEKIDRKQAELFGQMEKEIEEEFDVDKYLMYSSDRTPGDERFEYENWRKIKW